MSTQPPPPPDRPTQRLDPAAPPPPPGAVYEERVIEPMPLPAGPPVVDDTGLLLARLEDAIGSLRTAVTFVGVLAVLALGLALYAVLNGDNANTADSNARGTRDAASSERVSNLDDRVDRLSRQVQSARAEARSGGDTSELSSRVDALSRQVQSIRSSGGGASAGDLQQLGQRVDDLGKRVDDLASQSQTTP